MTSLPIYQHDSNDLQTINVISTSEFLKFTIAIKSDRNSSYPSWREALYPLRTPPRINQSQELRGEVHESPPGVSQSITAMRDTKSCDPVSANQSHEGILVPLLIPLQG